MHKALSIECFYCSRMRKLTPELTKIMEMIESVVSGSLKILRTRRIIMSAFKVEDCIPKWLPRNGETVKLRRKFAERLSEYGPSGKVRYEFNATVDHVKLATGGNYLVELCLVVEGVGTRYFFLDRRVHIDCWMHDRIDEGESWDILTVGGKKILPPKKEEKK